MEVTSLPRPAGLPSPRSPTLSEISMILPEGDRLRSVSPTPHIERPPSPSSFYAHSNRSTHTIKLGSAPQGRRGPSPQIKSPPLSAQSSRSTLRNMNDSEAAARGSLVREDALASSPTVHDGLLSPHANDWNNPSQRRLSSTSSSSDSDDFETMKKWPGFDSHSGFDDSGVGLDEVDEDGEEHDQFPVDVKADDEKDNERWLNEESDDEDSHYSSDLYSKRAEMILANAKKRLNVMEGNMRAARQSLVVSPTLSGPKMASELSHQISAARERDRRLYAGIGPIPPRTRQYYASPLSANNSPGHARGLSETSVPLPFASPTYMTRNLPNKRASSAMGVASGPWSPEGYGNGRFPIRESRSFEVMRDQRGHNFGYDERDHSLRSQSRGSRSPPNVLETLPEDESPKLHRSSSTTSSLRDQMNDLKGRISSLKLRAKEDHMRRRSLQSLRTPSPFTSAEIWYSGAEAYKNGGSPIAANAGVGMATESPTRKALYEDETTDSTPRTTTTAPQDDYHGAVKEVDYGLDQPNPEYEGDYVANDYGETQRAVFEEPDDVVGQQTFDDMDESDNDFVSVDGEDVEGAGDSVYEDAVYEMPVAARHEDRVDAFDYENFFLHSAMGTYSGGRRGSGSSSNSTDSVATTRPVTAIQTSEEPTTTPKRISMHQRNSSVDSVSTVATFATAAEEHSDDEEENEQMDRFSEQLLPGHSSVASHHATPNGLMSPRSDSAVNMRKINGSPPQVSRGSSPGGDLVTGLQTSKIYSILLETPREEPRLALNEEEKQLIYSLAASLQQVCGHLQSTSGDQYERKEWRRRLDEARRVLNGEELEGQPF